MLGIFKSGVMAGALVLLMLNRLQMLKESRGQRCPDREGRRPRGESKHQTDPTGGRDRPPGHISLLLSTLNHSSPFPSPSRRCVLRPFLPVFLPPTPPPPLLSIQYLLNAPVQFQFHPPPAPSSSLLASLEPSSQLWTVTSLCVEHTGIYLLETWMQMNARRWFIFCSKSWLESSFLKALCSGAKRNVQFPSI